MDLREGMMAVVCGLPDSALSVSLLDGNRQYTLAPNAALNQPVPGYVQVFQKTTPEKCTSADVSQDTRVHRPLCRAATQAVDGRYASVYQMSHCNIKPTSPPVQVAEFPPQRAELCPGHGNFVVGGLGSGETSFSPTRANGSFRGGMNWPDRGAVCTPRPSHEPDAFAKSLRKYPALSPERSSEIVERLINYTSKNVKHRSPGSPTRCESNYSSQAFERRNSLEATLRTQGVYRYTPDVNFRPRVPEESPTRDTTRKYDSESFEYKKPLFGRNFDVRCALDMNKKTMDSNRIVSSYPCETHPVFATINESVDHLPSETRMSDNLRTASSVHVGTQVEIPMTDREAATVPREDPSTRNVSVSLSQAFQDPKVQAKQQMLNKKSSSKLIQPLESIDLKSNIKKSVQTCVSSIDIGPTHSKTHKSGRKTKSEEELRMKDCIKEELLQLVKDLECSDVDKMYGIKIGLLKKLKKFNKPDRNDQVKIKFGKCVLDQLCSQIDFRALTKELSNELMSKIKKDNALFSSYNATNVFRADICNIKSSAEEKTVDELIRDWLDDIPLKSVDNLGRKVDNKQVLHTVTDKIKCLLTNKVQRDCCRSLKPEILDILKSIPVEVDVRNKKYYLKRVVHDLVEKIENVYSLCTIDRKRWKRTIGLDKVILNNVKEDSFVSMYVQPTENELKQFVQQELNDFATKFKLKICACTAKEIELELIDILIDSLEALRHGNEEQLKNEILILISDLIQISQQQAIYFANNLINNLKDMFKKRHAGIKSQTFIVLQNSLQNASMQTQNNTTDNSIGEITEQDIQNNLDLYTQEIVQEINEWMAKIQGLSDTDAGFKQVVAHDLAGDIVDRHKYLELNPNGKGSDEDELEHLKYQIFKWVNKLVQEDNLETIEQAPKLMQRIQNIPVPMLTRPMTNVNYNYPLCCQNIQGSSQINNNKSGKRRFSSPVSIKVGSSKDAYTGNENRRQSSPSTFDQLSSQFTQTSNDQTLNKTESNLDNKYIETMPTVKARSRSLSMSKTEPPKEISGNRRYSAPAGFHSNMKNGVSQTPKVQNYLAKKNASTRFPSPDQAAQNVKSVNKPSCCLQQPNSGHTGPTMDELNEKYEAFVKDWVQQVPISLPSPHEEGLEQKLRLGLYNGIWKAITKIKMNPAVLTNPFYYQDLLDDELEDLLDCLPPTPELTSKKHALKCKLIEETTDVTQQILRTPLSYKQQLVDNVSINIPKFNLDVVGQDASKISEDIQALILAEDFLMFTMYKETDKIKANVYKKKLLKHIQEFVDALKITHGKELKDIDFHTYKDEIMNALYKVPVPTDDTIKAEGDEILLGFEIEQWFSDLPLRVTDNYYETLNRKRLVDTLAKKIHDLELQKGLNNCEDELRYEITRFIPKLPLREGAVGHTQFIVDELVNRLKNRPKDIVAGSGVRRKSVNFVEPRSYDEFSRNMQLCSSFSDVPDAQRAQIDQNSFMVVGGDRVDEASYPHRGHYEQNRYPDIHESPQEWLSLLEESKKISGPIPQSQPDQYKQFNPKVDTGLYRTGQINRPQFPITSQTPASPIQIYEEPAGVQSQMLRNYGFPSPMGRPDMSSEQSMPRDPSLRHPTADSMHIQTSLRQDPYTSRQPETYISGYYPGATFPGQPQYAAHSEYPGPSSDHRLKFHSPGNLPTQAIFKPDRTPTSYRPGPSVPQADMRQFTQKTFQSSPDDLFGQPIGFSTPQQYLAPPRESRTKKRTREGDVPRREVVRKRLDVEDSDDDSEREETIDARNLRCRCMERVWRTCRKKRPYYCDGYEMDYPPCFPMRCPFPYYF